MRASGTILYRSTDVDAETMPVERPLPPAEPHFTARQEQELLVKALAMPGPAR